MKTGLILFVAAMILTGALATSSQASYISENQAVNFTYYGASYWAMIYDYTHSNIESKTTGYIAYDFQLGYTCGGEDVQVAYIYDTSVRKYIQALALRHVQLYLFT